MTAAFDVVFGVFVALILGLCVISVRWALRRDRAARAARTSAEHGRAGPAADLAPVEGDSTAAAASSGDGTGTGPALSAPTPTRPAP